MKLIIILFVAVGVAVADVSELSRSYLPPPLVKSDALEDNSVTSAPAVEIDATTATAGTTEVEIEQVPLEEMHYEGEQQAEMIETTEQPTVPSEQPPVSLYEAPSVEVETEGPAATTEAVTAPVTEEIPAVTEKVAVVEDVVEIQEAPMPEAPIEELRLEEEAIEQNRMEEALIEESLNEQALIEESLNEKALFEESLNEEVPIVQVSDEAVLIEDLPAREGPLPILVIDSGSDLEQVPVEVVEDILSAAEKEASEGSIIEAEPEPAHELAEDGYRYRTANRFRYRF